MTWGRLDANDRGQRVAEGTGIDLGAVAGDDAGPLETLDALGDRRGGQAHAPAEFGEGDAAVARELADDLTVGRVQFPKIVGTEAHIPVFSRVSRLSRLRSPISIS